MTSFGSDFEAGYRGDGLRAYTEEDHEQAGYYTRTGYLCDGGEAAIS